MEDEFDDEFIRKNIRCYDRQPAASPIEPQATHDSLKDMKPLCASIILQMYDDIQAWCVLRTTVREETGKDYSRMHKYRLRVEAQTAYANAIAADDWFSAETQDDGGLSFRDVCRVLSVDPERMYERIYARFPAGPMQDLFNRKAPAHDTRVNRTGDHRIPDALPCCV